MIVSPWSQLSEAEQYALSSKLAGLRDRELITSDWPEFCAERFNQFVIEFDPTGTLNHSGTLENFLTAQNFIAHAGGLDNSALWQQVAEIKGFRRSYLELTVWDRTEFLRVLARLNYVINREPFWTIHKFDSAREITEFSYHPALHFANDRANEREYGENYFFVHWDRTSPWFRQSNWPFNRLPGMRLAEQALAGFLHRYGCACPHTVRDHLSQRLLENSQDSTR